MASNTETASNSHPRNEELEKLIKKCIDEPDPVFADDLRNNYLNIPNYNNFSEKTAQEKTMLLLSQKYGFTVEEL